MSRRIIGQCSITDFKDLDQLALRVDTTGKTAFMLPRELTKKEKRALMVAAYFIECGVSTRLLQKIKEVLIWEEMPGNRTLFEYKLLDPKDRETALILMGMHLKEKNVQKPTYHP
jgi:hypothetical protein